MALLLLLIAGGYGFAGEFYATARDLVVLRAERKALTAEVERLRTELAVERATRLELERQSAELNAKVAELNGHVEFLRARRAPGMRAE
jgi:phage shock protein A